MSRTVPCLVFDSATTGADVVPFEAASRRSGQASGLKAEVAAIEAWYGRNAYTVFLAKHGCRPDPGQAATIGRLIGARVKAADGRLYPAPGAAERKALRKARQEAAGAAKDALEVIRLRKAIAGLAANTRDPADVIKGLCPEIDEPDIREQLQDAIGWLSRFAEEWQRRETGRTD
jgi:uncharacterized membrane protein